jgi:hypothetical protein
MFHIVFTNIENNSFISLISMKDTKYVLSLHNEDSVFFSSLSNSCKFSPNLDDVA